MVEKVALVTGGFGDGGVEGEGDDGGRRGDGFEVSSEEAKELFEVSSWLGDAEGGEMLLAVVEVEGEEKGIGDALMSL